MGDLFAAIKALWLANNAVSTLFTTQPFAGEVPELASFPAIAFIPKGVGKTLQTNKTLYQEFIFEVKTTHNSLTSLESNLAAVIKLLRYGQLNQYLIQNSSLYTNVKIPSPGTVYEWEQRYWQATTEFKPVLSLPVSPAGN